VQALLSPRSEHDNVEYQRAFDLVKQLRGQSTCHQAAGLQMIASCQSVNSENPTSTKSEEALDRYKSAYAARNAMCELYEAGLPVNPQCLALMSFTADFELGSGPMLATSTHGSSAEIINTRDLNRCLSALHKDTRSWTSYSNSKQNAAVLCEGSRLAIQKQEVLDLMRLFATVGRNVSLALVKADEHARTAEEAHLAFMEELKTLREEEVATLVEAHRGIKDFSEDANEQLREVAKYAANMLQSAGKDASQLAQLIKKQFSKIASERGELAVLQLQELERQQQIATLTRAWVEDIRGRSEEVKAIMA
jgi:hypothetical protein